MTDESITIELGADLTEFDEGIDQIDTKLESVKKKIKRVLASTIRTVSTAARLTLYTVQAVTGSIDTTLFSLIEAGTLAAESIATIATAESITIAGAVSAGLKFAAAIAIVTQVANIRRGRTEIANRQAQSITLLTSAVTFVG